MKTAHPRQKDLFDHFGNPTLEALNSVQKTREKPVSKSKNITKNIPKKVCNTLENPVEKILPQNHKDKKETLEIQGKRFIIWYPKNCLTYTDDALTSIRFKIKKENSSQQYMCFSVFFSSCETRKYQDKSLPQSEPYFITKSSIKTIQKTDKGNGGTVYHGYNKYTRESNHIVSFNYFSRKNFDEIQPHKDIMQNVNNFISQLFQREKIRK